ncbi:signal recognition particle protein Srp19 [Candidatus Bathyarchaeota archaeon]|nr:signal recognition particle protein Srp19 [Candidatus Bathyarchaeota archaeon]MBL7079662.1 signal recognition particle protein Srp19 [Candidatus Bathyarchaeota archaeon]
MRRKGRLVFWPAYFDSENTRGDGRRVPKGLALRGVQVDELYRAAEDLELNPELKPGTAFSKKPWDRTGSVLVDKAKSKTLITADLAARIRSNRSKR